MTAIGIRHLADNASEVVRAVCATGRPTIITKHGKPVAVLVALSEEALEAWALEEAKKQVADGLNVNQGVV